MITSLDMLKTVMPLFAFASAVFLFLLLRCVISLITGRHEKNSSPAAVLPGPVFSADIPDMSRYGRLIRKETLKHIWVPAAAGTSGMILLSTLLLLRRKIIACAGTGIFLSVCLLLAFSGVCCSLIIKSWKSRACSDLVSFTELFACAARDFHAGIMLMISCTETDFPFKSVLLALQKDNPGISGADLLRKAGSVLESETVMSVTGRNTGQTENYGYLKSFGTVVSLFSLGVILFLTILL